MKKEGNQFYPVFCLELTFKIIYNAEIVYFIYLFLFYCCYLFCILSSVVKFGIFIKFIKFKLWVINYCLLKHYVIVSSKVRIHFHVCIWKWVLISFVLEKWLSLFSSTSKGCIVWTCCTELVLSVFLIWLVIFGGFWFVFLRAICTVFVDKWCISCYSFCMDLL